MPPRTAAVRRRNFFKMCTKYRVSLCVCSAICTKKRATLSCCSLFLWPLFYELGLNLGNFLVYLVADELHKVQKEFPVGYLEDVLLAI